ncbi:uncharacterized protein [Penaeus vannamei]|uniref:uncharacterized protein isoform X2 n=1 Tax=Penaeus vannamei TaxID=6689 RepID=UPI00387F71A3
MYEEPCTIRPTTALTQVLRGLGAPVVRSEGEAEKLCAWLDQRGVVDGVISSDSDAFLYGAGTVYRQVSTRSGGMCKRIQSHDVRAWCGLSRWALIGVAALLGCDFLPGGVRGVGLTKALKLLRQADPRNRRDLREFLKPFFQGPDRKRLDLVLDEFVSPPALWDFVQTEMLEPDLYVFVGVANREWGWSPKESLIAIAPVLIRWHLEGEETPGVEITPVSSKGVSTTYAKGRGSPKSEEGDLDEQSDREIAKRQEEDSEKSDCHTSRAEDIRGKEEGLEVFDLRSELLTEKGDATKDGGRKIDDKQGKMEDEIEKGKAERVELTTDSLNKNKISPVVGSHLDRIISDNRERTSCKAGEGSEIPGCLTVFWRLRSHGIEVRVRTVEALENISMVYDVKKIDNV